MKYEITKEQLQTIEADGCAYIRNWFPEVFETIVEAGKWYKYKNTPCISFVEELFTDDFKAYGINSLGEWKNSKTSWTNGYDGWIEATESEVFEALKNEAVRRYKKGDYVKCIYNGKPCLLDFENVKLNNEICCIGSSGCLWMNTESGINVMVFDEGKWAEIIPTITKEEAGKLLNKKII